MKKLEYLYEDEDIIVCHKPAGMATEGAGAGRMDLVSSVRNYLARKNREKGAKAKPPYVGTVYRLDQPVEGVVVVAKNKKAASNLADQIKKHTTEKYYYALVYGNITEDSGHLKDNLGRREDNGLAIIVTQDNDVRLISGDIKNAELDYEVIRRGENITLLKIKLITGRFHQIRVQLSGMGYPIIGDTKYGNDESLSYSEKKGIKGVCLCCYRFGFKHPSTGKREYYEIEPEFTDYI